MNVNLYVGNSEIYVRYVEQTFGTQPCQRILDLNGEWQKFFHQHFRNITEVTDHDSVVHDFLNCCCSYLPTYGNIIALLQYTCM